MTVHVRCADRQAGRDGARERGEIGLQPESNIWHRVIQILSQVKMKIISWNVKGLNQVTKRKRVLSHLQHLRVGVAFLQETHLPNRDQSKIHKEWAGQMFHSQFNCKARGVAILIHKKIPFIVSNTISDPNGRYVMVVGELFQLRLVLVNIYGPNFDDDLFFFKDAKLHP